MKRLARIAIGLILLMGGAWLCVPGRNHSAEELRSECRWRDRATIRFWQGNGGATTAFWYSITIETGMPWTEREVFFSYSHPVVTGVTCQPDGVLVAADKTTWTLDAAQLLGQPSTPLQYHRGERTESFERGNWRPPEITRTAVGIIAMLAAVWLLASRSRRTIRGKTA